MKARARQPTVDVVVPCFNYARYLAACVDSVLGQDGVRARVLVIDDASTDATPVVGAELAAASGGQMEVRRHEANRGHIATYNEGLLGWADADYTVLLSADDLLAPGALARATGIMERDRDVGMVYGHAVRFSGDDAPTRSASVPLGHRRWHGADWIAGRCRAGHNVISSPEVVVRTSVQHEVGGYRPDLPHAGDLEMWLRIAATADVAFVRGRPQALYRQHEAAMHRRRFDTFLADLEQRRAAFVAFFGGAGATLADADELEARARRALAKDALWKACRAFDRDRLDVIPAAALERFALETYPAAAQLPEMAALRRRQRLGSAVCRRTQLFVAPAAVRKAGDLWWWRSWRWRGV